LTYLETLKPVLLRGEQEPLAVPGELFVYDTTDIANVDYHAVLNASAVG
jgi:hypothetical protein